MTLFFLNGTSELIFIAPQNYSTHEHTFFQSMSNDQSP